MDLSIRSYLKTVFISASDPKGMSQDNVKSLVRENSETFILR